MSDFGVYAHHRATMRFPNWALRDFGLCFKSFCPKVVANDQIVYSNLDYFSAYKDSTVFIIGGGPSTNTTDLDSVGRDYVWSCNHFYLNPKLQNTKVDLAMVFGEPNIGSNEFKAYRDKYNPYIGFEIHDRWFDYKFDNYDKYFAMHTKFYGRIGGGARMVIFASALGCKEVIFTGFDGPEPIYDGDHAFEPGKTTLPSMFDNVQREKVYSFWKNQSDYLWDYLANLYPNTKYTNIGGGSKYHEKIR